METPISTIIKKLEQKRDLFSSTGNKEERNRRGIYVDAILIATESLKTENQVIESAWVDGRETKTFGYTVFEDAKKYYKDKFQ